MSEFRNRKGGSRPGAPRQNSFSGSHSGAPKSDRPYSASKSSYGAKPDRSFSGKGDRSFSAKSDRGFSPKGNRFEKSDRTEYTPRGSRGGFGAKRPAGDRVNSSRPMLKSFDRPPRPTRSTFAPSYEGEAPSMENILAGRNPIREAIMAGRSIERILVARGLTGSALEIIAKARQAGIVVQEVDRARLDAIYSNHQGMLAYASAADYVTLEEIMAIPSERGEDPFFVLLDGITDPHNLGAILRSAAAAGAHGVIVPERRAAGLVPAAVKAAAGALEHIAVAKVGNLRQTVEILKEAGIWLMAADAKGELVYGSDLTGPICLVIGSEGDGVSPLVLSNCDRTLALPMCNGMESLNASVAAGILLYEVRRARGV